MIKIEKLYLSKNLNAPISKIFLDRGSTGVECDFVGIVPFISFSKIFVY
jgi:hypothetical protein